MVAIIIYSFIDFTFARIAKNRPQYFPHGLPKSNRYSYIQASPLCSHHDRQGRWRIHHRADPLFPTMRNKSILIAMVMVSSSLAGCTSENSEEDLSARYQEGYDAGYADAYDASYDGVAQHHYNEGWDDGWEIANSDSQAEITEMQLLASSLNETILSLQGANSDSQAEITEMQLLASSLNQTIQSLLDEIDAGYDGVAQHHYNEGWDDGWSIANSDSEEIISNLGSNLLIQQNLVDEWIQNAIMNDFSGTNFSNFDMSGADLSGSNLTGANLIGANLQSVMWSNTICPDGANSDNNGNTCENNL